MLPLTDDEVAALGAPGWLIRDNLLGIDIARALRAEVESVAASRGLRPAGTSRGGAHRDDDTRGDRITWLDASDGPGLANLFQSLETLRVEINRAAYLGLRHFEVQVACYPGGGARYQRHRDAFARGGVEPNRRLTAIYYLNPGWTPADGGALRLFPDGDAPPGGNAPPVDVAPIADRLVVFPSDRLDHEVLPSYAPRWAVTAWFYAA